LPSSHDLTDLLAQIPPLVLEELSALNFSVEHQRASTAIAELLNHTVLDGGKRLRPMLTLLVGNLVGADLKQVALLAKSIEQVHAASLAHDDVIDEATTRRGRPSINHQGDNKKAVLAGDYLLAQVISDLCVLERPDILRAMASVIQDLAFGEWIQWDVILDRAPTQQLLRDIADKKTASVMSWCTYSPCLLINADPHVLELSHSFGRHLGIAFQLMDDTLDELDSSAKDKNLDVDNDQVNAVVFEWMREAPQRLEQFREGMTLASLTKDADFSSARDRVKATAHDHLNSARECLQKLTRALDCEHHQAKNALETIILFLEERRF
jgi:geranylgeranyl pyrophosphate synthase